jgi:hypothetical protein
MRRRLTLAGVAAIALQAFSMTGALAQSSTISCDAFTKNADGTWTVLETTYIEGPAVKVQEGGIVRPGVLIRGYDIAAIIDKACPNAGVAPPPGTAPAAQQPQQQQQQVQPPAPTQSLLAKSADANGNIDVRQLTCGHLADTSAEEAGLLLSWYSGWYNGQAKGHGINLPRVRYAIRNVVDYCRANRDKRLSAVMDLMLK